MNCSRSRTHWLRFASLGFAGALIAAGCGGTGTKKDGGADAGDGGPGGSAALKLTPTSNDFASVEINKTSAPVVFNLSNSGGGTTGAPMISIQGGDFSISPASTCGALNAGASCMISVVFKPTSVGSKSGTLTVTASPGGTVTAALSGSGAMPGLNVNPSTHDFGAVAVGAMSDSFSVSVVNTGSAAVGGLSVTLSGADFVASMADNKCAGMTSLAAGASCTVGVVFKPTGRGQKNGTLTATGGGQTVSASLTGNGQTPAALAISPNMQVFAGQAGTQGTPVNFTVANTGDIATGAVSVALGGTDAGAFKITTNGCLAPLAFGASCTVSVAVNSATAGMKTATLTASSPVGGSAVAMLSATVDPPSSLQITPNAFDFMTVNVNATSAATSFEIKNAGGTATAPLTAAVSTSEFVIAANTCSGTALAAGATCNVSVSFKPTTMGQKSALLTVSGAAGETARATLNGTGVTVGLKIEPQAPNFGSIAVNRSGAPTTLTVTNIGGNPSGALSVALTGASASQWSIMGNNCNGSLAPAATCTVALVFSPTNMGDKMAQLVVSSASGAMATADLTGSGVNPAAITITSAVAAPFFAETVIGQTSAPVTFTIGNPAGNLPTGMLSFMITNVAASEYSITTNNCMDAAGLAGGNTCTIVMVFKPAAAGARNASLVVNGASSGSATGALALAAVGAAPIAVAPQTNAAGTFPPGALLTPPTDFGMQSAGTVSAAKPFNVLVKAASSNVVASVTGEFAIATPLTCNTLGPAPKSDFSTVSATDPTTWFDSSAAGKTCWVTVTFNPVNPLGTKTGTLTLTGTGGVTSTTSLVGTSVGPLQITPSPVDYGAVAIPSNTPRTLTVANNGSAAITSVTTSITGANASEFVITSNPCVATGTIAAAGNCMPVIALQPTSAGAKTATLTVNGLVGTTPQTASVILQGSAATGLVITLTPATLTIGNVPMTSTGKATVTLANPAGAPNTGLIGAPTAGGEFSIVDNNCVGAMSSLTAGQSCTFAVQFAPAAASGVGTRSATVTVSTANAGSASILAVGTATQPLTITGNADFGPAAAFTATALGATRAFTITNASTAPITILATTPLQAGSGINPQLTWWDQISGCAGNVVPASASCTVTLQFHPPTGAALGLATAALRATDATGKILAVLPIQGTVVPDATLSWVNITGAQTRDFGEVAIGATSAPVVLTLKNTGGVAAGPMTLGTAVAVEYEITGTGTNPCVSASAGPPVVVGTSLAAGATCTLQVVLKPTAAGAANTTLTVAANNAKGASATAALPVISLAGTRVAAGIAITPSPATMPDTAANATAAPVTLTYTNSTGSDVVLTGTPLTTADAKFVVAPSATGGCTAGLVVGPSGVTSCTFTVTFTPGASAPGYIDSTVTVNSNGGGTRSAGVNGRVKANAVLTVTAPAAGPNFGAVLTSAASAPRVWTIKNDGEATSGALSINSDNTTDFSTAGSTCGAALPVGSSCTVSITANPATVGAKMATITISGSAVDGSPVTVAAVTATGSTPANLTATIGGTAVTTFDYGNTNNFGNPVDQVIDINNITAGGSNQTTGPVQVTLTNTTDFTVSGCDAERVVGIANAGTCALTVTLKPQSVGAISGSITISASPGGSKTITLVGTSVPSIVLTPATQAFAVGATHTFTATLTPNTNPTTTGPLTVKLSGTDAGLFTATADTCSGVELKIGHLTCTVDILYTGTSGTRSATLSVTGTNSLNTDSSALTSP